MRHLKTYIARYHESEAAEVRKEVMKRVVQSLKVGLGDKVADAGKDCLRNQEGLVNSQPKRVS